MMATIRQIVLAIWQTLNQKYVVEDIGTKRYAAFSFWKF